MSVKLYYFDGRGICEPIRWILSYGGVDFEDNRAPMDKFPPTLPPDIKAKSRWGQVPVVEFEGKSLTQSTAVTRYFARKYKLVPEDAYLAALCDEYVDATKDSMQGLFPIILHPDPKEKEEKLKEYFKTFRTRFLDVFESIVKANGGKGHLVGDSLTWADIVLAYLLDHFKLLLGVDLTEGYPNIKNVKDMVMTTPKIKAWIEKRPKTKF
jgi:glutathione S-transferase